MRYLDAGADPVGIAQGVEVFAPQQSVVKMIMAGAEASGLDKVLMVGGVLRPMAMCGGKPLRQLARSGHQCSLCPRRLSSDNAVGVAAYGGWRALRRGHPLSEG